MAAPDPIPDLLKAVNDASGRAFALWVTFLSVGSYLAITVGTTTDVQLLLGGPVKLPLLGVDMPLFSFYGFAPLLFVLLHLYVLMQLYLLSSSLHVFDSELKTARMLREDRRLVRTQLDKFLLTQLFIAPPESEVVKWFLRIAVWLSFAVGPVMLLLGFQIRFLPYHSVLVADMHRGTLAFDLLLLWLMWPMISHGGTRIGWFTGRRRQRGWWAFVGVFSAAVMIFSVWVATVPGESFEKVRLWAGLRSSNIVLVIPTSAQLFEADQDKISKLDRTITLAGRDLRGAFMIGVDLRKSFMLAANLMGAKLMGANFSHAYLAYVNFNSAELTGASLTYANLSNAGLSNASMSLANLTGANLAGANLIGADLNRANLTGTDLSHAYLTGATLIQASLNGAKLLYANLDRANLSDARLNSADLSRAQNLFQAQLDSACGDGQTKLPPGLTVKPCPQ